MAGSVAFYVKDMRRVVEWIRANKPMTFSEFIDSVFDPDWTPGDGGRDVVFDHLDFFRDYLDAENKTSDGRPEPILRDKAAKPAEALPQKVEVTGPVAVSLEGLDLSVLRPPVQDAGKTPDAASVTIARGKEAEVMRAALVAEAFPKMHEYLLSLLGVEKTKDGFAFDSKKLLVDDEISSFDAAMTEWLARGMQMWAKKSYDDETKELDAVTARFVKNIDTVFGDKASDVLAGSIAGLTAWVGSFADEGQDAGEKQNGESSRQEDEQQDTKQDTDDAGPGDGEEVDPNHKANVDNDVPF